MDLKRVVTTFMWREKRVENLVQKPRSNVSCGK